MLIGLLTALATTAAVAVALLIRERRERAEAREHFSLFARHSSDMITRQRPEGTWVYVSPACRELLGWEPSELIGRKPAELAHPEDAAAFAALPELLAAHGSIRTITRMRRADGTFAWLETNTHAAIDADGRVCELQSTARDVGERKALEDRLRELADRDELTGLFNRRRLVRDLERELATAARHGRAGALMLLDLDGFKGVNDAGGHSAGDELLRAIARTLDGQLRAGDVTARIGGDEFAFVLPDCGADEADVVGDRIRSGVESLATPHPISVSIGIAAFGPVMAPMSVEQLLTIADAALYEAKRDGGRATRHGPTTPQGRADLRR